jgi:hypothetical protein
MGEEQVMKCVGKGYSLALILVCFVLAAAAQDPTAISSQRVPGVDDAVVSEFQARVRQYTSQRETIESEMQALPKEATAEQIAAHKSALLKKVLASRKGATRGQIFTPEAEKAIRSIIAAHYTGRDSAELRKKVAEAENKTVAVKVNAVYPEAAELLEMPPKLLLALPELPKQVRYRFVGNNLLIVDRENHLIVDYMTNALP